MSSKTPHTAPRRACAIVRIAQRPSRVQRTRAAYGDPDVATLAAAYAFGIARDHPFVDGNKRMALLAAEAFLIENGFRLIAEDASVYEAVMKLAAGKLGEAAFAAWIRKNLAPA